MKKSNTSIPGTYIIFKSGFPFFSIFLILATFLTPSCELFDDDYIPIIPLITDPIHGDTFEDEGNAEEIYLKAQFGEFTSYKPKSEIDSSSCTPYGCYALTSKEKHLLEFRFYYTGTIRRLGLCIDDEGHTEYPTSLYTIELDSGVLEQYRTFFNNCNNRWYRLRLQVRWCAAPEMINDLPTGICYKWSEYRDYHSTQFRIDFTGSPQSAGVDKEGPCEDGACTWSLKHYTNSLACITRNISPCPVSN